MRKNKKKLLITVLAIVISFGVLVVTLRVIDSGISQKSDQDIKNMFECNRITMEVRATDVYCSNPEQYRIDFKNGEVIN